MVKYQSDQFSFDIHIHNSCVLSKDATYMYRISGIFRMGVIFAEFATSLKSPKIDTAKNNPYYTSTLKILEIVKIELGENLTCLPRHFRQNFPKRKIPDIQFIHFPPY